MKNEYQTSIIRKVRKLREDNGYSQAQLATILGLSNGQVGNIESTKSPHKYTLAQLHKICKLFNFPIECLFIGDENPFSIDLLIKNIINYEE